MHVDPLEIPTRTALRAQVDAANRRLRPVGIAQTVATVALLALTSWGALLERPLIALVAVGVAVGQLLASMVVALGKPITWAEALPADKRFGALDRDGLLDVVRDVQTRMGLSRPPPVAVSPDRNVNASIMLFDLGGLVPRLHAVYVHRPMLHLLNRDELKSVIGHELAHAHRAIVPFVNRPVAHVGFLAALYLALLSWLPDFGGLELIVFSAIGAGWFAWLGSTRAQVMPSIEFLCDDVGAQAAGVVPALSAEVKLALSNEVTQEVVYRLAAEAPDLPLSLVFATWERVQPYEPASVEQVMERVRKALVAERKRRKALSISGFVEYLSGSPSDEDERAARKALQAVPRDAVPVVAWDREGFAARGGFDEASAAAFVAALEAQPGVPFVALAYELGALVPGGTHPTARRRVLYLWRNRGDIEADAATGRL